MRVCPTARSAALAGGSTASEFITSAMMAPPIPTALLRCWRGHLAFHGCLPRHNGVGPRARARLPRRRARPERSRAVRAGHRPDRRRVRVRAFARAASQHPRQRHRAAPGGSRHRGGHDSVSKLRGAFRRRMPPTSRLAD
jgi:hypothetical protein